MAINPNTAFSDGNSLSASELNRFPRGVIVYKQETANYTLTTSAAQSAATNNFALTFTSTGNRFYRITYYEPAAETSTASTSYTSLYIYAGTSLGALTTQAQRTYLYTPGTQKVQAGMLAQYVTAPAAGTIYVTAAASTTNTAGAPVLGRNVFQPAQFIVEDMGPF